jgi:GT2 family glycosyltransferase
VSDHAAAGADARVQVQVVLYNSGPKLTKLVRGLDQLEPPDGGMTVRFLNNRPGDGCEELLTTLAPTFAYTYSDAPDNLGFGRGHNHLAQDATAEYLWLLNPDTIPFYDCLRTLVGAAEAQPRAALIEAAQFPIEHPKMYDDDGATNWCCAAALLVRRDAFHQLGGFDESLFLYGEDVDLSWRAWLAGWRCIYVPTARCCHISQVHDHGKDRRSELRWMRLAELWLRARYFGGGSVGEFDQVLAGELSAEDLAWVRQEFTSIRPTRLEAPSHPRIEVTPEAGRYAAFRW